MSNYRKPDFHSDRLPFPSRLHARHSLAQGANAVTEGHVLPTVGSDGHGASSHEHSAVSVSNDYTTQNQRLEEIGIKVRDYAYIGTLSPIAPTPQFVGVSAPSKRARDDDPTTPLLGHEDGSARFFGKRARRLSRELTEPIEPLPTLDDPQRLSRNPALFRAERLPTLLSLPIGSEDASLLTQHHETNQSNADPQPVVLEWMSPSSRHYFAESQESDPWGDSLPTTPRHVRSWQSKIKISSAIPPSQLDTESQQPIPDDFTFSQLGFSPDRSQQYSQQFSQPSVNPFSDPYPVASSSRLVNDSLLLPSLEASEHSPHRTSSPPSRRYNLRAHTNTFPYPHPATTTAPTRSRSKSSSRSPTRPSRRIRSPRPHAKQRPPSVQPETLRRSARNASKPQPTNGNSRGEPAHNT